METFLKIISLLKMPLKVVFLISIVTGLLLFLPSDVITKLQLSNFIKEFGNYIGIVFIFTIGYIIITIIPRIGIFIKNYLLKRKFNNKIEEILNNLTFPEICFLREFVIQGKEVIEVPIDNTEYISLYNKSIVIIASQNVNRYVFGNFIFIRLNEKVRKKLSTDLLALPPMEPTDEQRRKIISERPQFLSTLNFRDRLLNFR